MVASWIPAVPAVTTFERPPAVKSPETVTLHSPNVALMLGSVAVAAASLLRLIDVYDVPFQYFTVPAEVGFGVFAAVAPGPAVADVDAVNEPRRMRYPSQAALIGAFFYLSAAAVPLAMTSRAARNMAAPPMCIERAPP